MVYKVLIESGARLEHMLKMIENWEPNETIEIPSADLITKRLVCFQDKGFCRYYMVYVKVLNHVNGYISTWIHWEC